MTEQLILTEAEMQAINDRYANQELDEGEDYEVMVAMASQTATLKRVGEWSLELCPHSHSGAYKAGCIRCRANLWEATQAGRLPEG